MSDLASLAARENITNTVVVNRNTRKRWQKFVAFIVTQALATGGLFYALYEQPTSASVLYSAACAALSANLLALIGGNVAEHKALSERIKALVPGLTSAPDEKV